MTSVPWGFRRLAEEVWCSGFGIHSGTRVGVQISGASAGGVSVVLGALSGPASEVPVAHSTYMLGRKTSRLRAGDATLDCPEHLFAGLLLAGISGAVIHVPGSCELPCEPAGAASYYDFFSQARLSDVRASPPSINWNCRSERLREAGRVYVIEPSIEFSAVVRLSNQGAAKAVAQSNVYSLASSELHRQSLGRARTWVRASELDALRDAGLCGGVHLTSCRVLSADALTEAEILEECARHKLADLLGDLYLLGQLPPVHLDVENPNHAMNARLLQLLMGMHDS